MCSVQRHWRCPLQCEWVAPVIIWFVKKEGGRREKERGGERKGERNGWEGKGGREGRERVN